MNMLVEKYRKAAQEVARAIGNLLRQDYVKVGGVWWLFSLGRPVRRLSHREVYWHVRRGHAPFVRGGITRDDPHWFE